MKLPFEYQEEIDSLRAQLKEAQGEIKNLHKQFGCELLDPYGTIWEQAAKLKSRAEAAEKENERLRELLKEIENRIDFYNIHVPSISTLIKQALEDK